MGTPILRRYVLLGPIGRGGVSMVYHAVDAVTPRPLAIKLLAPTLVGDARARDNVRREALITQRLRHPSVPKVYDYGDAPLPDGTVVPYVVMELLTGVSLAGRVAGGAMPWREAVSVAATVADVLAVAHRRGVVHRDLGPENLMMTTSGLKIIDFGLAITVDDVPARTPRILRPAAGRPEIPALRVSSAALPADDVYALGVLLYQMLTGRSPYPTATGKVFLGAARFRGLAPTPVLDVPGLPAGVADICRACMAKRPEDRPPSGTVALALWSLLSPARHRTSAPDRGPASQRAPLSDGDPAAGLAPADRRIPDRAMAPDRASAPAAPRPWALPGSPDPPGPALRNLTRV